MTAEQFRALALAEKDAIESSHGGHPDFRVNGRVFASLGAPDDDWGMVALTPEEQASFIVASPNAFRPATGAWGLRGYTNVHLASGDPVTVKQALAAAHAAALRKKSRKK